MGGDIGVPEAFAAALSRRLGPQMKELWLFGSRARGDAREDSDYDFLVVVDGDLKATKAVVREEEWNIARACGCLITSIVYPTQVWKQARDSPLGWNVLAEGRRVA